MGDYPLIYVEFWLRSNWLFCIYENACSLLFWCMFRAMMGLHEENILYQFIGNLTNYSTSWHVKTYYLILYGSHYASLTHINDLAITQWQTRERWQHGIFVATRQVMAVILIDSE